MPEADLLGVHFDMQLLAKLTVSAAAILFVTWVFRFYSTRSRGQTRAKKRLPPPRTLQTSPETCKTVLEPLKEKEANDGENRSRQSAVDSGHGICQTQKTDAMVEKEESKETKDFVADREESSLLTTGVECNGEGAPKFENLVTTTEESSLIFSGVVSNAKVDEKSEEIVTNAKENSLSSSLVEYTIKEPKTLADVLTNTEENSSLLSDVEHNPEVVKKPVDYVTNKEEIMSPSSAVEGNIECPVKANKTGLNLIIPNSDVTTSPSGRRSPCHLKKLDGGVEIGRELRQNMGHVGTFSSFQSKAGIKVENADLVIEGRGDKNTAVRGKIYEYFVETSSQSVSDVSPTHGVSSGYGTYEAKIIDKPRSPSPLPSSLIIRDLEFSIESDKASDRVSIVPIRSETGRHLRRGFIRKDSYLAAAAESEVQIPFPPPVARSRSLQNEYSTNYPQSPKQIEEFGLKYSEDPKVETVARAQFFHLHGENIRNSELESLNGKLDLGNCLEALMLAKKDGHNALQQAALRVMSDNYFQVLRDPNLYGRLKAGERDQIQRQRNRGRKCLMVADMDSPDWTWCSSQSADTYTAKAASGLYYYHDYSDTWHLQGRIPKEVFSNGCAMCTMDNYLFVAVGFQSSVPSKRVFCYNPMTSIWSEICPMNEARPHCKLVALQDYVYAIGGECLSTVERYDPRTNRWIFVAPLPNETFAVAHRATACNGELFVSGGTLKYTLLRYNPKNDAWRQSLIVGSKERTTEMIAVRNFLYRFDVNPNVGISVYRYHVVAKLWYECCSKKIPYCHSFQCVAIDDIIYCVNRQFTMRFLADEKSPGFVADDLQILTPAKGILFPFVLSLPDKSSLQTSV